MSLQSSGEDINFIVEKLNEVLQLNLTLVSFDELSGEPHKLLQLLNTLLASLSSIHNVDLSKEQPEATVVRIKDFLITVLGMKQLKDDDAYASEMSASDASRQDFASNLLHGERTVIYPILTYILQRYKDLKTRVYLAKYLVEIKVPQEMLTFDGMLVILFVVVALL